MMDPGAILAGTLAVCVVGGFLPWVNVEAAVAGAALLLPRGVLPLLVLGAAGIQVLAKGTLYCLARWAPRGLPRRARAQLERLSGLATQRRSLALTVLSSSTVGVPPLYLVTLACGSVAVPPGVFLAAAFLGTVVRYAVISVATVLLRPGT
jgi:membrane protein YqaA with SNARE-associated domain